MKEWVIVPFKRAKEYYLPPSKGMIIVEWVAIKSALRLLNSIWETQAKEKGQDYNKSPVPLHLKTFNKILSVLNIHLKEREVLKNTTFK